MRYVCAQLRAHRDPIDGDVDDDDGGGGGGGSRKGIKMRKLHDEILN